jgi:hypothetical protein
MGILANGILANAFLGFGKTPSLTNKHWQKK